MTIQQQLRLVPPFSKVAAAAAAVAAAAAAAVRRQCLVVYGGVCMVVYGGVWWCMVVYGGVWWCMVVYGGVCRMLVQIRDTDGQVKTDSKGHCIRRQSKTIRLASTKKTMIYWESLEISE